MLRGSGSQTRNPAFAWSIEKGYFGGTTDTISMRITDYFLVIPDLPLAIIIAAVWGASLSHLVQDMEIGFDIDVTIDPPGPACGTTGTLSPMARSIMESGDPAFDEGRWRQWLDMAKLPANF